MTPTEKQNFIALVRVLTDAIESDTCSLKHVSYTISNQYATAQEVLAAVLNIRKGCCDSIGISFDVGNKPSETFK